MQGHAGQFKTDEPIHWANGACMIVRKKMVEEIGLMDKNLVFIGSDSDYSFTARSRGWSIWRICAARGVHDHGASATGGDLNIEKRKLDDMLYFSRKWLTGDLYKKMAYEGPQLTPQRISELMQQLENGLKIIDREMKAQAKEKV